VDTELLVVPASLAQQSLWVHSRVAGSSAAYHVTALVRMTGPLRFPALRRALEVVTGRHESLRTVFRLDGDELMQVIQPRLPPALDLRPVSPDDLDGVVADLLARPFDLATGPLLRLSVLRLSPDEHVAVLVMHHIITDAVSSAILLAELAHVYEAETRGTEPCLAELPIQYADYAMWHRRRLSGERLRRLTGYWSARLAGAVPLGHPDGPAPAPAPATLSTFRWPAELTGRLQRLAAGRGATPFMVLVAGFAAVLARYHGQSDITVVSPVAGRGRPELAGVVGYFINAVPIRVDLSGDPTVTTLLDQVRVSSLEAYDHQELPIEQVSALLRRLGGPGAERICSGAMVVLQEPRPSAWQVADLTLELLPAPAAVAKADVVLDMRPDGGELAGSLECDQAVLTQTDGAALIEHLTAFLGLAAGAPDARVAELIDATVPVAWTPAGPSAGRRPRADRLAGGRASTEFAEPRTPMEAAVADLWSAVLGEGPIGVHDNFFDLGGQSLAAVRLAARLRETFGIEVSIAADLYRDFTVAAVAKLVADRLAASAGAGTAEPAGSAPSLAALPRPPGELRFPASPAQEGMWARLTPDRPPPVVLGGLRVRGALDIVRLERAFAAVAARHETLRSTYHEADDELVQVISPEAQIPVAVRDAVPADYADTVRAEIDRGFDLGTGVPARVVVLRFAPDDHAVLVVLHHIIGDGRTLEILAADCWACYAGRAGALPPLPVQFADFARWHRELLAGPRAGELIGYWADQLAGATPATVPDDLTLSGAKRPGKAGWAPGTAVEVPLPQSTFDSVVALAARQRVTLNSAGLAAFAALLARSTGDREICVRAPVSYRDDSRVQDLVADFSNDVVIRLDLSGEPTFADLLRQVDEVTAEGFAHHELPPHLLEPHLTDPGLLSRLFRVQFTTEREVTPGPAADGLAISAWPPPFPYANRPLSVRLRHGGDQPKTVWIYDRDLFSRGRIDRLAVGYADILAEMATDLSGPVLPADVAGVGESPDCDGARARGMVAWSGGPDAVRSPSALEELE
jgi:non-ribosomal peptide synthetase component F